MAVENAPGPVATQPHPVAMPATGREPRTYRKLGTYRRLGSMLHGGVILQVRAVTDI